MVRLIDRPTMTIAVDLGRKATKTHTVHLIEDRAVLRFNSLLLSRQKEHDNQCSLNLFSFILIVTYKTIFDTHKTYNH